MKVPFQLQPSENVTMVLRRHWLHLYPRLAAVVLVAVVPPIVLWWTVNRVSDPEGLVRALLIAVCVVWTVVWLIRSYLLWYRYENDLWILTDERLVDSLKRHWFHHRMASVDLVDIEDVAVIREGVLRTMFDYGDVQVQTAAQQANFLLTGIPKPGHVLASLDAARDAARQRPGTAPV